MPVAQLPGAQKFQCWLWHGPKGSQRSMKRVFAIINELEEKGAIESYALGGAMALLFYSEPIFTQDIDIFVFLPKSEVNHSLIDLSSIYDSLKKMGYSAKKEYVIIEGMQVQFLPAYNDLVEEAVKDCIIQNYEEVPVKVLRLEYLIAIMLDTNRAKDRARIGILLEQDVKIDQDKMLDILSRYKLQKKWERLLGEMA